jgi:PAS domain S-box-containing protein
METKSSFSAELKLLYLGECADAFRAFLENQFQLQVHCEVHTAESYTLIDKTHTDILILNITDPESQQAIVWELLRISVRQRVVPVLFIIEGNDPFMPQVISQKFPLFDVISAGADFQEYKWRIDALLNKREKEYRIFSLEDAVQSHDRQLLKLNNLINQPIDLFSQFSLFDETDMDKKIVQYLKSLGKVIGTEFDFFLKFNEEDRELVLEATAVGPSDKVKKPVFQFDDPLLAPTAQNFVIQLADNVDLLAKSDFIKTISGLSGTSIVSVLLLPIVYKHKLYGIFAGANKLDGKYFSIIDKNFAELAINYAAKEISKYEYYGNNTGKIDLKSLNEEARVKLEFYREIINSVQFGVMVLNNYNQIIFANQEVADTFEIPVQELIDTSASELFGQNFLYEANEAKKEEDGDIRRIESEITVKSGKPKLIGMTFHRHRNMSNQHIGTILTLRDISKQLFNDEEMLRMDRLASLGFLIAGIAHEIRNPLAGIKAVAEALENELKNEGLDKSEYVERIVRQVNRLNRILQSLYLYSRPDRTEVTDTDIAAILEDIRPLLEKTIRQKNILYQEFIDPSIKSIRGDQNQIQQMLVNLLLNSIESLPEKGVLSLRMDNLSEIPQEIYKKLNVRQRRENLKMVMITITDTGDGIAEDELKNIFSPFYTTKPNGTGLGLPIVQKIVHQHDGHIEVISNPGKGTRFELYFPADGHNH